MFNNNRYNYYARTTTGRWIHINGSRQTIVEQALQRMLHIKSIVVLLKKIF